jgi:hypothetical protein
MAVELLRFDFGGLTKPLIFRTNWSATARISSSVATGSRSNRVLMFLHVGSPVVT